MTALPSVACACGCGIEHRSRYAVWLASPECARRYAGQLAPTEIRVIGTDPGYAHLDRVLGEGRCHYIIPATGKRCLGLWAHPGAHVFD